MPTSSKCDQSVQLWTVEKLLDLAEQLTQTFGYNYYKCKDDLSLALEAYSLQEFTAGWDAATKETS
jgi:hypothetical protein